LKKIAIIPARSGSKGLKNKNILNLCGKPLIAYSIEAALMSNIFDKVVVSTDSEEYRDIALSYGSEVIIRSQSLSSDNASSFSVIKDVLEKLSATKDDEIVLLQPTSPLRTTSNIIEAYNLFEENKDKYDFLVSVSESGKASSLIQQIDDDKSLKNFDKNFKDYARQKFKEYYPNGAIFIGKVGPYLEKGDFFGGRSLAYFMSKEESVDIDDFIDFQLAITLLNNKRKKHIVENDIEERIKFKKSISIDSESILLMGHSIIDFWDIQKILSYNVSNLGISGITTSDFYHKFIERDFLTNVPNICVLMFGINDIKYNVSKEDIRLYLQKIITYLKVKNSKIKIYIFDILNVNGYVYIENNIINEINELLHKEIVNVDRFIGVKELNNNYGKLSLEYTNDGLHLNNKGYKLLGNLLLENLNK
jgi:N-acylneuraminate cytidylyltransferase